MDKNRFRRNLRNWYATYARDLPWRRTTDPYAILVSEFMAQQTQVATVVGYFKRWMRVFPTVEALAAAEEEEVLSIWQGLGYYSRGRNLLKAARVVVNEWNGVVPSRMEDLERLPGVGRYTAAAVAAFAFDLPTPVVDGNIARLLARVYNHRGAIDARDGRDFLESAARELQSSRGGRVHNSAMMELGALVCRPRSPLCLTCPVRSDCAATDPDALPVKRARAKVESVVEHRALVWEEDFVWLQMSPGPRWKGMWILPEISGENGRADHVEMYPITRYRVEMRVSRRGPGGIAGLERFSFDELQALPIPAPHRRAIDAMIL